MNKLILVGNGFDLAHGLPTSYKDFLNDFWKNIHLNYKKDEHKKLVFLDENYFRLLNYKRETETFKDFEENLISYQNEYSNELEGYIDSKIKLRNSNKVVFKFENIFFKKINTKNSIENWVDIENEYYLELKRISSLSFGGFDEERTNNSRKVKIQSLNKKFEQIKIIFEIYLHEKVVQFFDFNSMENLSNWVAISELLKPIIISKAPYIKEKIERLSKEFSFQEDENEIINYKELILSKSVFEPIIFKSQIISFNYIPTVFSYNHFINRNFGENICSSNYIHGAIFSKENRINFGFGDEMDSSYRDIENIGDNEYLKNFKSFQYSNTQNYNKLLRYIDSEKYQVYILGHSCGLSDRLLLNTIFEHENCRSIKVFYYQKNDIDNYTDIVQNISRHFQDKQSMRRKIVNKTLCSPLPQNVRFKKKV